MLKSRSKPFSIFVCILLFLCVVTIASSCTQMVGTQTVGRVLDGSSFTVGDNVTIKLLGVEAPNGEEAGFPESIEHLRSFIEGQDVRLVKPSFVKDSGDTYLRIVYDSSDDLINETMIRHGYAKADTTYLDADYTERFLDAENSSKEIGAGLWAGGSAFNPAPPESIVPVQAPAEVFVGSRKSNVYHYPSCYWAQQIHSYNLVEFSSAQDAVNHGYRPCKVCNPPWP